MFTSLFDLKSQIGLRWIKAYNVIYVCSFSAQFCVFCYLLTTVDHYLFTVFLTQFLCCFFSVDGQLIDVDRAFHTIGT